MNRTAVQFQFSLAGWLVHGCKNKPLELKVNRGKEGSDAGRGSEGLLLLFLTSDIGSLGWVWTDSYERQTPRLILPLWQVTRDEPFRRRAREGRRNN